MQLALDRPCFGAFSFGFQVSKINLYASSSEICDLIRQFLLLYPLLYYGIRYTNLLIDRECADLNANVNRVVCSGLVSVAVRTAAQGIDIVHMKMQSCPNIDLGNVFFGNFDWLTCILPVLFQFCSSYLCEENMFGNEY